MLRFLVVYISICQFHVCTLTQIGTNASTLTKCKTRTMRVNQGLRENKWSDSMSSEIYLGICLVCVLFPNLFFYVIGWIHGYLAKACETTHSSRMDLTLTTAR